MTSICAANAPKSFARRRGAVVTVLAALAAVTLSACGKQADESPPKTPPPGQNNEAQVRLKKESENNLKQIMLALHNFQDTYRFLPPAAICDRKTGKPLLSWRVAILPYIEQVNVFKQLKLDEAWDSPHNKKFAETVIPIYAPPGGKPGEGYKTYYRALVAAPGSKLKTAWEMLPNPNAPFGAMGARIPASFPDGTSNTLGVVEAGEAVPWTKPDPLVYDAKKPLPKLGGLFKDGFHAGMMDGSVRFISNRIDDASLRALITANGGEMIPFEELEKKGLIK